MGIEDCDYVGVTAMTPMYPIALEVCKSIKRINRKTVIVLGGYHATFFDRQILRGCRGIDIVVRGEGEKPFLDVLNGVSRSIIPGITYRDEYNKIRRNPDGPPLQSEEIPIPAYHLLSGHLRQYRLNISTVRGCRYKCSFCVNNVFWGKERFRNLKDVMSELTYLADKAEEGTLLHFCDNNLAGSRHRLIQLCNLLIEAKLPFSFSCDLRVDHVDEEAVRMLRRAGFVRIMMGVEDADDLVLDSSSKGLSFKTNLRAARLIKENSDIIVSAYWLWGLPGSSRTTVRANIQKIAELFTADNLIDEVRGGSFVPLPGTVMYSNPEKFGMEIISSDWSKYLRDLFPVYRLRTLNEYELYLANLALQAAVTVGYMWKWLCRKVA